MLQFTTSNMTAILVAVVASTLFMMLWYSKAVFGAAYMKECNLKDKDCKPCVKTMALGVLSTIVVVIAMSIVLVWSGASTWLHGIVAGAIVGIGFGATQSFSCYLWSSKSFKLFLINSSALVLNYMLISSILLELR